MFRSADFPNGNVRNSSSISTECMDVCHSKVGKIVLFSCGKFVLKLFCQYFRFLAGFSVGGTSSSLILKK